MRAKELLLRLKFISKARLPEARSRLTSLCRRLYPKRYNINDPKLPPRSTQRLPPNGFVFFLSLHTYDLVVILNVLGVVF